jgi:hypothetical protein
MSRHKLSAALAMLSVALAISVSASAAEAIAPPSAGKGQIVFYRLSTIFGGAMGCSVFRNGEKLLELGIGRYRVMEIEPGQYTFTNRSGGLEVAVAPNERRYVMCKITTGVFTGTPTLSISDEASFQRRLPNLKPSKAELAAQAEAHAPKN